MSSKYKIFYKIIILLLLVLFATVTFWGTFTVTAIIINAIPIYGLSPCVLAIFSAFITGLALVYLWLEDLRYKCEEQRRENDQK